MTVKMKVFSPRGFPTAYPFVAGVNMQRIWFRDIVKKIVPNKLASYVIVTVLADVTLS